LDESRPDLSQIKTAKRLLLRTCHPDKDSSGEAETAQNKHVQEIVAASDLLEGYCHYFGYSSLPENPGNNYIFRVISSDRSYS